MVQKGSILILKPYVDNQHDDKNNNMVSVKKVNDHDNLLDHIRNTYTERSNMEIKLMICYDNDPIRIKNDGDYQFFLEVYKDSKKEIKVYFEPNGDPKFPMQKGSKLRWENIEDYPEQNIQLVPIVNFDKKEIKNGKFLIAYCDEFEDIEKEVNNDVDYFKKIAKNLGFSDSNIDKRQNPGKNELLKYFDTCGEKNNVDCFVFAFSGHGHIEEGNIEEGNIEEGNIEEDRERDWVGEYIYLNNKNDTTVTIRELVERLRQNEYLTGVPKIMLLNACRGAYIERKNKFNEEDFSYLSEETTTTNTENIIIAYSTIPNKVSWTGDCGGSHFTECLSKKIEEDQQKSEFHQLLTEVNDEVAAYEITFQELMIKGIKQTSCFRSSLCEEIYFK